MKSGIYIIENLVTKKVYVGRSNNVAKRLAAHRYQLRNNKSCNSHMQLSFNKYGEEVFRFFKAYTCPIEQLKEKEEYWIKLLDATNPEKGFNFYTNDNEVDIRKQRELKNRQKKIVGSRVQRNILILNAETGEIVFDSNMSEIQEKFKFKKQYVQRVLAHYPTPKKATNRSYKGFIFVYADKYDPNFDYTVKRKATPYTYKERPPKKVYEKKGYSNNGGLNKKSLVVIKDGVETTYESLIQACRELGLKSNKVYATLRGDRSSHHGYTFKRV